MLQIDLVGSLLEAVAAFKCSCVVADEHYEFIHIKISCALKTIYFDSTSITSLKRPDNSKKIDGCSIATRENI